MIDIDDKLLKIVELARNGVGGEKEAAIELVKKRCAALNLEFDDVMHATGVKEYVLEVPIRNKYELDIVGQVCFRFATTPEYPNLKINKAAKVFFFYCTPDRYIETDNAAYAYLRAFRNERKKLLDDLVYSFIYKHKLVRTYKTEQAISAEPTAMTFERELRIRSLMNGLDDVTINKQIGAGDNEKN